MMQKIVLCNASCLDLRLGDMCGRCGGLVDIKPPAIAAELVEHLDADCRWVNVVEIPMADLVAMAEGPKPRAADDADAIQKAMREIYERENRKPVACAPGQHNFQWVDGVYTCAACGRGRHEDGR